MTREKKKGVLTNIRERGEGTSRGSTAGSFLRLGGLQEISTIHSRKKKGKGDLLKSGVGPERGIHHLFF